MTTQRLGLLTIVGAALAAVLAAGATGVSAQGLPGTSPNKCLAGKTTCVLKKAAAKLKCHEKAEKSGSAVDQNCLDKATHKFDGGTDASRACFTRLESKAHPLMPESMCTTVGDLGAIESKVDAFVSDVVTELDPQFPNPVLNRCSAGKKKCVNKKISALLKCRAKCQKNPSSCGTVETACRDKAKLKFDGLPDTPEKGCFARLEAKQDVGKPETMCPSTEDRDALEAKVDAFLTDVLAELETQSATTAECEVFSPAGNDRFDSFAVVSLRILPVGSPAPTPWPTPVTLTLDGPVIVQRGTPDPVGPPFGAPRVIDTEIISMALTGSSPMGPVTLRESLSHHSKGLIKARSAGNDFPADSFFDIFFEIETALPSPMDKLHNNDAIPMRQVISCIPPLGRIYVPAYTLEIPLYDRNGTPVASLTHAKHHVPGPTCGDGHRDPWEQCDDGNQVDCDGCDSTCTTGCQNGIVCAPPEDCDDGNATPGDGCEPDCKLTPHPNCTDFPPAGTDSIDSFAVVSIAIPSLALRDSVFLYGLTTIERGDPVNVANHLQIATEITSMSLSGTSSVLGGAITVRESQSVQSNGLIKAQLPGPYPPSFPYPANSFFDVFFEVETGLLPPLNILHNAVPIHQQQVIKCIPPFGRIYFPAVALTIPLLDADDNEVATLTHARHYVRDPFCGDGTVDVGEDCDDRNKLDCDGCDSNCTFTACGNGIVCAPEQCDDMNPTPGDGCEPDCTLTPAAECIGETCGHFTGTCDPGFPGQCFCFTVAEYGGKCVDDFRCSTAEDCPGGTSTCPGGKICYVSTCCGGLKCGPSTCTGVMRSVGASGGPMASGN